MEECFMSDIHSVDVEDDQFAYRYDTQLLIDRRDRDLDEDEIADYITENFEGNSLIAAGDEDLVKIHFHTNEPWKVLARSRFYLLGPQEPYECVGDVPNVTFPCAALADSETGRIAIYYGCADTVTGLAFTTVDELLKYMKEHPLEIK